MSCIKRFIKRERLKIKERERELNEKGMASMPPLYDLIITSRFKRRRNE